MKHNNMRRINIELIFKITVIILLLCILFVVLNNSGNSNESPVVESIPPVESSQIGRYKEIEDGKILDTETGEVQYRNGRVIH